MSLNGLVVSQKIPQNSRSFRTVVDMLPLVAFTPSLLNKIFILLSRRYAARVPPFVQDTPIIPPHPAARNAFLPSLAARSLSAMA